MHTPPPAHSARVARKGDRVARLKKLPPPGGCVYTQHAGRRGTDCSRSDPRGLILSSARINAADSTFFAVVHGCGRR